MLSEHMGARCVDHELVRPHSEGNELESENIQVGGAAVMRLEACAQRLYSATQLVQASEREKTHIPRFRLPTVQRVDFPVGRYSKTSPESKSRNLQKWSGRLTEKRRVEGD